MDPNREVSSVPTYKRIIYACLAGALIIALAVVVGFGIHHHHDTLQSQMTGDTWTMYMMLNGQSLYKRNAILHVNSGTDARVKIPGEKPIDAPIRFNNTHKNLTIGNQTQNETLHNTTNTSDSHSFVIKRVMKNGIAFHKHMKLAKRDITFNFVKRSD